ncbi:MAG: HD domain-containing protein, partial [Candidatus Limivivens sp.]|nr:HD domain-containing protein [Candidatus Limivivens sp.]
MRKNRISGQKSEFTILTLDDDRLMTEAVQSYFQAVGYQVDMENDPRRAIERIRQGGYDILLLDFLMQPICGDEVVRQIREFDRDLFIILLTGHKSMAPPIRTIRELDIQGYYEKSDRFDQLELLIESCAKSIRQMRTIRRYRDGLRGILEKVPKLSGQKELFGVLEETMKQITEHLPCKDAFIRLDFSGLEGEDFRKLSELKYPAFLGIGAFAGINGADLEERSRQLDGYFLEAVLYTEKREPLGVLKIRTEQVISDELDQIFQIYAKQVGAAVNNCLLQTLLQIQNRELCQANDTLRRNTLETIDTLRRMVEANDSYTRGHSDRVAFYSAKIAERMGRDSDYIERVRVAGLFHDIGKIGIYDNILRKNSRLTSEEYEAIKKHPSLGRQILSSISYLNSILPAVECHHEHFDGTGYPFGLKGRNIPEEARIIAVADAFDAMTSKRSYRNSLSLSAAEAELRKGRETQFDSEIVD